MCFPSTEHGCTVTSFCQGALPAHAPPSQQTPLQDPFTAFLYRTTFSTFPKGAKQKEKKNAMVRQQKTDWYFGIQSWAAHSTGTEEKHLSTWGQKAGWALGASLHAYTWTPWNPHLMHRLQISQLHNLCHRRELHQGGAQCSIFPPSSPERGEKRGPHLPVSVIISSWFAHLGMLTSLKNKAKMALYC